MTGVAVAHLMRLVLFLFFPFFYFFFPTLSRPALVVVHARWSVRMDPDGLRAEGSTSLQWDLIAQFQQVQWPESPNRTALVPNPTSRASSGEGAVQC